MDNMTDNSLAKGRMRRRMRTQSMNLLFLLPAFALFYGLKEILDIGEENGFAVPAFNVYNLETVMGVMQAAEETGAPVIFQMYSRLFDSELARYVAPIIREAMHNMKTPVAFHLDHGAGIPEVLRAFRYGATGVMIDASRKPIDENITITKGVVEMAGEMGITVEGELGEVGKPDSPAFAGGPRKPTRKRASGSLPGF